MQAFNISYPEGSHLGKDRKQGIAVGSQTEGTCPLQGQNWRKKESDERNWENWDLNGLEAKMEQESNRENYKYRLC